MAYYLGKPGKQPYTTNQAQKQQESTTDYKGILTSARLLLTEPDGWFQGDYANTQANAFCLVGACVMSLEPNAFLPSKGVEETIVFGAEYDQAKRNAALNKALQALGLVTGTIGKDDITDADCPITVDGLINRLAQFNDADTTTHAHVVQALEQALSVELA